eukprot:4023482-Lingulodinium_polyedra.AAC.1
MQPSSAARAMCVRKHAARVVLRGGSARTVCCASLCRKSVRVFGAFWRAGSACGRVLTASSPRG